jgi:hypothetical protein
VLPSSQGAVKMLAALQALESLLGEGFDGRNCADFLRLR